MKVTGVLVGPNCHPQVRRAARDLGRYLNKLFGMNPPVRRSDLVVEVTKQLPNRISCNLSLEYNVLSSAGLRCGFTMPGLPLKILPDLTARRLVRPAARHGMLDHEILRFRNWNRVGGHSLGRRRARPWKACARPNSRSQAFAASGALRART